MSLSPRTTRRELFARVARSAQGSVGETSVARLNAPPPPGLVPRSELVNVPEFEAQAERALTGARVPRRAAFLKSGDRAAFDRITLRPRMCISTTDLDLGITLFGERHFAPVIVGPVGYQRGYHVDGEGALVEGANAAQAGCVLTDRASVPLERLPSSTAPRWFQGVR